MVDEDLFLTTSDDELATFEEVRGDACWRKAMIEEMTSIEENEERFGKVGIPFAADYSFGWCLKNEVGLQTIWLKEDCPIPMPFPSVIKRMRIFNTC